MAKALAANGQLVLAAEGEMAVVIDTELNMITASGSPEELLTLMEWPEAGDDTMLLPVAELVDSALNSLDLEIITAAGGRRMYTIPAGVQAEAKKSLEWRKKFKRGGTPVGLNTARTLARGGQIGIEKVRHIAKYFPRHEVDKKGKGWSPGEDGFPSRGRIAWALWGGDAAWRWARAIVERENKRAKALKAAGEYNLYQQDEDTAFVDYNTYTVGADTSAFEQAYEGIEGAPEFMARVRMDGSGIDRLYKIDLDGKVYVWDSGYWDDLGSVYGDIYTYDAALDDPYDRCQKAHVQIDPEAALMLSAFFQVDPFTKVSVGDLDAEEARLAADGAAGIDWALVEQSMVAAGEDPIGETTDGYTPEERAENAGKQVRDGSGRFAAQGTRVSVTGRPQGVITGINPTNKMVTVQHDDGTTSTVPASSTRRLSDEQIQVQSQAPTAQEAGEELAPFDTSGILAEPRTPSNRPGVQIPGTLPPLTRNDLAQVLSDYPAWVASQRDLFKPLATGPAATPGTAPAGAPGSAPTGAQNTKPAAVDPRTPFHLTDPKNLDTGAAGKALKDLTGVDMITNAYSHPALAKWLAKKEKKDGKTVTPNALWYQPITSAGDEKPTTPAFDVKPIYMAIVADDDPLAVVDLISIVPESLESNEPMTYARRNKKWERDPRIITDLKSATPPSVVPLDEATLNDVLLQLDGHAALAASATIYSLDHVLMALWGPNDEEMQRRLAELQADDVLVAAGGVDRNRGNAEALRRYWTKGKGAAKIRWGTGGDWKRCVRYLGKYLGPRAKGYCALRHKEVTGLWTGDQKHRKLYGWGKTAAAFATEQDIRPFDDIMATVSNMAHAEDARERVRGLTAGAKQEGAKFHIPLVIPEGVESGDGRIMRKGSLEIRELPLPLMWQIKTGDGHDGSVVVGRIDRMERTDQGIGNAYGVFDTGVYGREAERMVREGFIKGVSADLDKFEADEESKDKVDTTADKDGKKKKKDKLVITKARVMGVTIVPKPAFQECKIVLQQDTNTQEDTVIQSGTYVEDMDFADAEALIACGYVAGAIPLVPPSDWFNDPKLDKPTPLTVDDSGRVYGHIAAWHVDHIGMAYGTRPPRSKSKYAYFHTGVLRTENGSDVPVGQLTLAGGHAPLHASASEAAKHYDDTASAIADVHAGEDAHGIWVAGSLRPGATPEQIRALRASAPSGDWRPIKGSLELVAVCQVNVPGFPIARARVASGSVMALVAAGAQVLAKMKSNPVSELENRLRRLESIVASGEKLPSTDELKARVAAAKAEMAAQAEAQVLAAAEAAKARFAAFNTEADASYASEFEDEMAYISRETRKKLASEGKALPDGSYPIRNVSDLRNAIQAYGRAKNKAAAKRHIIKRARGLGKADLIPGEWTSAAVDGESLTASVDAMRARAAEIEAELKKD